MKHPQTISIDVEKHFDEVPILVEHTVLVPCPLTVHACIDINHTDADWPTVTKIHYYSVRAEYTMDDDGEVSHMMEIRPYQVGFTTWTAIENAVVAEAKEKAKAELSPRYRLVP